MTHEEMFNQSPIKVGMSYRFAYPDVFVSLPEYSNHRNQTVVVIRPCREGEADVLWDDLEGDGIEIIVDRMFVVQAQDGWIGHAWETELAEVAS